MRVAVVDYGAGNTLSVTRALQRAGAEVELTPDPARVLAAGAVVLPGVGAFGDCVRKLAERGLDEACREHVGRGGPLLGVCVGLQVLFEGSEESPGAEGLGLLPGRVVRFSGEGLRVPHMGWNTLRVLRGHPVLEGLDGEAFYFVHSYHPEPAEPADLLATSSYGGEFCAAAGRGNLVAVQFHPEKSSRAGLRLYENFLRWARGAS
ncbi:imidazole glycerol phosphate synthase subunit hisH [Rubrobacter xylanophilus DSM 9941]|uniref:Imidazole glycerol phosphate synthase subunit HisH n=1 Tax=Rubrobacter xylanophilus (strain DSM 9941 / JCM 11954 / NBRC 16129 / PRD-1) TaxID=266117 RepID=Q1AX08_RUBXD|nr:imidazole glycerol phosphate synthase subunit HisH [Rubrobacter xylanophilus]ABG04070.1 imidazole glycerol phosphate synthase subunit hisH [Rubrobacter xylanophilus DSM 9941]